MKFEPRLLSIIPLEITSQYHFQETTVAAVSDPFEGAEAEEETDFQPSNPAPYFFNGPQLKSRAPINTLTLDSIDSNFGVAVTPIQVDTVIYAMIHTFILVKRNFASWYFCT